MKTNVLQWLDNTAERFANKVAFADANKELTYCQLNTYAKAIASGLIQRNVFKKPVVVYINKGVDAITAFMGIAYSGNFYSPIDTEMPPQRANKILEILQPDLVITTMELKENAKMLNCSAEILIFEDIIEHEINSSGISDRQSKIIDTDLLYVLFTSGSTGTPKGVAISHRSVIDYIDWVTETFLISEEDSFGNQAPFYFDNSVLDIYSTIKCGATCYIIPKELFSQPALLLNYLKEKKINTIFWVPSALIVVSKLKALKKVDLSTTLKRVLFAGEVMPNKQLNIWRAYLPNVQYANLYGPTEITVDCTCYIVDREFSDEEPLPIGVPVTNTDVLVLNDDDELVQGEEVGELCVRGTSLALGYYNNPQKTREAFVQNPLNRALPEVIYRTGDLVRYNSYGELIYLSRKDSQIKHLGHRIELGEIETAVSSIPKISLCCCLYDEERSKIVLFTDAKLDREYIIEHISKLVPKYMYPGKVITLEHMPINANGKIDRVKLKEML